MREKDSKKLYYSILNSIGKKLLFMLSKSHCLKSLLNINNNFNPNAVQNRIIQFFRLFLSKLERNNKTGKTLATAFSNHNDSTIKNIFPFLLLSFHSPCLMFCLSCPPLKGNREATKFITFTCVFSRWTNSCFLFLYYLNNIACSNYPKKWKNRKYQKYKYKERSENYQYLWK